MRSEADSPVKILIGGIAATAMMSLFSYWRSYVHNKQFAEPQLLAALVQRLSSKRKVRKKIDIAEGWALHLAAGMLFIFMHSRVWKHTRLTPGAWSGLLLGAANGLGGISVWRTVFKRHPDPPEIDFQHFYWHLFIAHLIFGATAGETFRWLISLGKVNNHIKSTSEEERERFINGQNPDERIETKGLTHLFKRILQLR